MPTDPRQTYRLFFNPGEITEVRATGLSGRSRYWDGYARGGDDEWVFGYFNDADLFAGAVKGLDQAGATGIYFTPNVVKSSALAKAKNKIVTSSKKRRPSQDQHIEVIRWLLVDFDSPVEIKGISSTDEEMAVAADAAKIVAQRMRERGWADPIKACSGNGYHLCYRIQEIPCTAEYIKTGNIVKQCLAGIAEWLKGHAVDFDLTVHNPARIWKCYGTWARKGEHCPDLGRPHRQSYLFADAPDTLEQVPITPMELVEALAAEGRAAQQQTAETEKKHLPARTTPAPAAREGKTERMAPAAGGLGPLKVDEYLAAYGIELHSVDDDGAYRRYNLRACLFNPDHRAKDAAIVQETSGKLLYHCSHNSCSGYRWQDAKKAISGEDDLKKYHENYDPNFHASYNNNGGRSLGTGLLAGLRVVDADLSQRLELQSASGLPSPLDIDPAEFFEYRGKRPAFVVDMLVNYLAAYLAPLRCTDGVFWRYTRGCWRKVSTREMLQIAVLTLKDKSQADWARAAVSMLEWRTNLNEDKWVVDKLIINLKNGVIDLRDCLGETIDFERLLKPHDPKYGSRSQLDCEYDPQAKCDQWVRFLWQIFPEGRECSDGGPGEQCAGDDKIMLLQQFLGYILMPNCEYERAAFFIGSGGGGKSTLIKTLIHVIGKHNTIELSLDELARGFFVPYLQGKMLAWCSEMVVRDPLAISNLKKCISGDIISGEYKHKDRIDFWPSAKFLFAMNEIPSIVDKSYGFRRKVSVIRFDQRFGEEESEGGKPKDPHLVGKLAAEKNGIFLWMLEGAVELARRGEFQESAVTRAEGKDFFEQMNPLLMWIRERCIVGAGQQIQTDALFGDYVAWTQHNGLNAMGKIKFNQALFSAHGQIKIAARIFEKGSERRGYKGIALRPDVLELSPIRTDPIRAPRDDDR